MTEPRDPALPSEPVTAPPSQTRVVMQVLLIIVGVAFGLWALRRLEWRSGESAVDETLLRVPGQGSPESR